MNMLLERIAALGLSFGSWLSNSPITAHQQSILDENSCAVHDFKVKIFSTDPVILYLEHFLTENEARHLIEVRHVFQLHLSAAN